MTTLRRDCIALTIAAARNGRCGGGSCGVVLARCATSRGSMAWVRNADVQDAARMLAPSMPTPAPGAFALRGNHPGAGRSRRGGAGARATAVVRAAVGPAKEASLATGTIILAQDRRFFGWAAAMPAAHDVAPYDTSPQGRVMTDEQLRSAVRSS